jgi:hypothetical protein
MGGPAACSHGFKRRQLLPETDATLNYSIWTTVNLQGVGPNPDMLAGRTAIVLQALTFRQFDVSNLYWNIKARLV